MMEMVGNTLAEDLMLTRKVRLMLLLPVLLSVTFTVTREEPVVLFPGRSVRVPVGLGLV